MRVRMSKSSFAGLAALLVSIAVTVPTPAAAFRMGGGGFHGGGFGGGFHGGGFGGWRGGGFGGWRGGYGWGGRGWGGRGWGYGGWGCCGWGYAGWGYPWWGLGWGYPYGYGDDYGAGWVPDYAGYGYAPAYGGGRSCWAHRKVWTRPGGRGRYLGRRLVNVCQ
jgi:hypothetical protein